MSEAESLQSGCTVSLMAESLAELYKSLSKAQAALKGATKDSSNPHFRSKYSDLESCWEACREALTSNGLCVSQHPVDVSKEGFIGLETILAHSSGQTLVSRFSVPLAKMDAQAVGSAITYMRRYALCAVVGISPTDDDGNAATAASAPSDSFKPTTTSWKK